MNKHQVQSHQKPLRRLNTQDFSYFWNDFPHHPTIIMGMIIPFDYERKCFPFAGSQDSYLFSLLLEILFLVP